MLSCKQITERASDYLDRQLSLTERVKVGLHLLFCRHCRKFVRHLKAVSSLTRKLASRREKFSTQQADAIGRAVLDRVEREERG